MQMIVPKSSKILTPVRIRAVSHVFLLTAIPISFFLQLVSFQTRLKAFRIISSNNTVAAKTFFWWFGSRHRKWRLKIFNHSYSLIFRPPENHYFILQCELQYFERFYLFMAGLCYWLFRSSFPFFGKQVRVVQLHRHFEHCKWQWWRWLWCRNLIV